MRAHSDHSKYSEVCRNYYNEVVSMGKKKRAILPKEEESPQKFRLFKSKTKPNYSVIRPVKYTDRMYEQL